MFKVRRYLLNSASILIKLFKMVDYIFWTGVELLKTASAAMGITYQEINVYLFIILHPALTLFFFLLWFFERLRRS